MSGRHRITDRRGAAVHGRATKSDDTGRCGGSIAAIAQEIFSSSAPTRVVAGRRSSIRWRNRPKLNGLNPHAYLAGILDALSRGHSNQRLAELTPWAWAATHRSQARSASGANFIA